MIQPYHRFAKIADWQREISGLIHTIGAELLSPQFRYKNPIVHQVVVPVMSTVFDGASDKVAVLENSSEENLPSTGLSVLLIHGFGGKAREAKYERMTKLLCQSGHRVFRMNHRGAGEGQKMSKGIFHGGRSGDMAAVLDFIKQLTPEKNDPHLVIISFSLSGDMALNLLGRRPLDYKNFVLKLIAVCPAGDPIKARQKMNRAGFGILMKQIGQAVGGQIKKRHRHFPEIGVAPKFNQADIFSIDRDYMLKFTHYQNEKEYYLDCDATPFLSPIAIPTLIISTEDDPISASENFGETSNVKILGKKSGGHCGFLSLNKMPGGGWSWWEREMLSLVRELENAK